MGLRVCSFGHAPLTVMPIYGKIMTIKKYILQIFSLVDRIGRNLHICSGVFHLGEQAVAHGPRVC